MTSSKLKEHGKYLGFSKSVGYVYKFNEETYTMNGKGIVNITHLKVAL